MEERAGEEESSDEESLKQAALKKYHAFSKMHADILDPGKAPHLTHTHAHTYNNGKCLFAHAYECMCLAHICVYNVPPYICNAAMLKGPFFIGK